MKILAFFVTTHPRPLSKKRGVPLRDSLYKYQKILKTSCGERLFPSMEEWGLGE